jgi:hypothetical protein
MKLRAVVVDGIRPSFDLEKHCHNFLQFGQTQNTDSAAKYHKLKLNDQLPSHGRPSSFRASLPPSSKYLALESLLLFNANQFHQKHLDSPCGSSYRSRFPYHGVVDRHIVEEIHHSFGGTGYWVGCPSTFFQGPHGGGPKTRSTCHYMYVMHFTFVVDTKKFHDGRTSIGRRMRNLPCLVQPQPSFHPPPFGLLTV